MDTSSNNDFLAFSTSPKTDNGPNFYPQHYSSPMHNNRNRNKQNFNFQNQYGGNKYNNKNYGNRKYKGNGNKSNGRVCEEDISKYFHPSMLEDPWEKLIQNSKGCNTTINNSSKFDESTTDLTNISVNSVGGLS